MMGYELLPKSGPDNNQRLIMISGIYSSNVVSETALMNSNVFSDQYSLPGDRGITSPAT